YLQSLGSLERDVEPLDLEELQGVSGLRALLVTVSLEPPAGEARGTLAAAARRGLGWRGGRPSARCPWRGLNLFVGGLWRLSWSLSLSSRAPSPGPRYASDSRV